MAQNGLNRGQIWPNRLFPFGKIQFENQISNLLTKILKFYYNFFIFMKRKRKFYPVQGGREKFHGNRRKFAPNQRFQKPMSGFIVTCQGNRERVAVKLICGAGRRGDAASSRAARNGGERGKPAEKSHSWESISGLLNLL